MAGSALLVRLVVALLRVTGKAGRAHGADRRPALGRMTSRGCTARGMHGASVCLPGRRVTRGAVPFVRVMIAVTRSTGSLDGLLLRITVAASAVESRMLIVRESQRARSRLRPHRQSKRRGYLA